MDDLVHIIKLILANNYIAAT